MSDSERLATIGRCLRPTKTGSPCRRAPVLPGTGCLAHLADAEREQWEMRKARAEIMFARVSAAESQRTEPACWAWPVPTDLAERTEATHAAYWHRIDADDRAELVISEWQADRCAICERRGGLVTDHDHVTGLVRGLLCHSCNIREGCDRTGSPLLARYRERPPAVMLGVRARYYSPLTGYAEPMRTGDSASAAELLAAALAED